MSDPGRDVTVVFPDGRGTSWWKSRNATSPVPGYWPYGLEKLASDGVHVVDREVPNLDRLGRLRARTVGLRRRRPRSGGTGIAVAWDEICGVPMVNSVAASTMYCGVIWATDQLGRPDRADALAQQRGALLQMDGLWTLSRPQTQAVTDWLGAGAPPVHFLRFGVDEEFYAATPYPDVPMVVSIGGDRDRDADTLFAALAEVRRRRPDARCVAQTSSTATPPEGVETHAHIPHDQVRKLYAQASVVTLATRPNLHVSGMTVALEAMSSARPVVVTGSPGFEDYVRDGIDGATVATGDGQAMAEAILGLLDDPAAAAKMGRAGRSAVEEKFTTTQMCRQMREIVGAG